MFNKNKKAALEMSVGTIVVIVLSVSMLIFGIILIRSIMCGAIGLTGEVNEKVEGELNRLFGASGGEVQCIGAGGEPVRVTPGQTNIIYCSFKAKEAAQYTVSVTGAGSDSASLTESEINQWILAESWSGNISPADRDPKKVIRIRIPEEAPEALVFLDIDVTRDGSLISTQAIDLQISRTGIIRSTIC